VLPAVDFSAVCGNQGLLMAFLVLTLLLFDPLPYARMISRPIHIQHLSFDLAQIDRSVFTAVQAILPEIAHHEVMIGRNRRWPD
jgi:hypothetical protein